MALTAIQCRGVKAQKTIDEKGVEHMTAEVPYRISGVDSLTISAADVLEAAGLPSLGSAGHGGYCIGFRAEQPEEATATTSWRVTVQYGQWPVDSPEDPEDHDPDPTQRPASITRRLVEREEVLFEDYSDPPKAIVNTLGEPFDPGVMASKYRLAITIQRYVGTGVALGNDIRLYGGKTNANAVQPFGAGELLCRDISEVTTREGLNPDTGLPYLVVSQTIVLEADPGQWVEEVLNRGTRRFPSLSDMAAQGISPGDLPPNPTLPTDGYGVPTGEIVLLDQNNREITWKDIQAGAQPHFIPFRKHWRMDFGGLLLPNLLA